MPGVAPGPGRLPPPAGSGPGQLTPGAAGPSLAAGSLAGTPAMLALGSDAAGSQPAPGPARHNWRNSGLSGVSAAAVTLSPWPDLLLPFPSSS